MSLTIRLTRIGKKGERKFRIAVKEKRSRRDGKAVELLGYYQKGKNGRFDLDQEKYKYWLSKSAIPSKAVEKIVGK
jgi:small subunit ribosomal protein S16